MNIPDLESLPMWRDASGAIRTGGRVRGMASYGSRLDHSMTGISYAGRVQSLGGDTESDMEDYTNYEPPADSTSYWKGVFGSVIDAATPYVKGLLDPLLETSVIKIKEKLGYKVLRVANVNGKSVVVMKDLNGRPVYIGPKGEEIPVTPESQGKEIQVDSSGRYMTAGAIGIGVVAAGLLLFMLMRRR